MEAIVGSLLVCAVLTWVMLVVASIARTRAVSIEGICAAVGNRDGLPTASPFAGRADRAAKNMVENLVLFAVVLLAASIAKVPASQLAVPCTLFAGARLTYAPLYWAGVSYFRTFVWGVSIVALGWIAKLAVIT